MSFVSCRRILFVVVAICRCHRLVYILFYDTFAHTLFVNSSTMTTMTTKATRTMATMASNTNCFCRYKMVFATTFIRHFCHRINEHVLSRMLYRIHIFRLAADRHTHTLIDDICIGININQKYFTKNIVFSFH